MSDFVIDAQDLKFRYRGVDAFQLNVDQLQVERGKRIGLIGSSGCGKSTLLRLLAGIHEVDGGKLSVLGENLATVSDAKRRAFRIKNIGFVFQEFELVEYLSALENVLLAYRISGALKLTSEIRSRAKELLASAGLEKRAKAYPAELSQGEKQRVAICRALLAQPSLIFADEPTGNLDPQTTESILQLLFDQIEQSNATLVFVTHDLSLLDRFDVTVNVAEFHQAGTVES